ncbi:hypothetical protein [Pleurocapsa sp. PCC 7319]|uniref:hypothetical protein n=1 Tax=Pleurocapsa sp. PCC 7319 TaxID=118161 RepID=UPI0008FC19D0|nr:hypothetical protein [Pleurocapsa sp. PCC 7319]
MNVSTVCPCCSSPMLHYLDHNREYWFCRNCWQEMPDLKHTKAKKYQRHGSIRFSRLNQPVSV